MIEPRKKPFGRRTFLTGVGGVTLGLPLLESLRSKDARAQATEEAGGPFAIFFRQANGVACAQTNEEIGTEPERFWPRNLGALDAANVEGRALGELSAHLSKLLVVRGVHMEDFDYADGHARGALQCLTAAGPVIEGMGGDSEANGESIDHRIGRQMNPNGRDSLFLYTGENDGWLGGPCVSYRSPNVRRAALRDPWSAYEAVIGVTPGLSQEAIERLARRRESVNDLVRGQLSSLLSRSELSREDRDRLDLHLTSIRDLENNLACRFDTAKAQEIELHSAAVTDEEQNDLVNGDFVLQTARLHMDIAVIAVACGYTRSVAIQVGPGNDAGTRYRNLATNELMENFHYLSHRRASHDASGGVLAGSDVLHSYVDIQFARTFAHLVDRLAAYNFGDRTLLDDGVAIWLNDLGNGPAHGPNNIPWIMAGSCGGQFKQGQYIDLTPDDNEWGAPRTHARVLNAIGTAVGCRTEGKDVLDDFGDASLDRTPHPDLFV